MKVGWFLRRGSWWLPALFWASLIFYLSSQSQLPGGFASYPDYLLHFTAYALLGGACALGVCGRVPWGFGRAIFFESWVLAILYGASDEIHQAFVPARTPSLSDLLADTAGALCAILILASFGSRRH